MRRFECNVNCFSDYTSGQKKARKGQIREARQGLTGIAHHQRARNFSLKAAVVEVLETNAPNWVSTDAIESAIRAKFGLSFETPVVRKHWYNGSFRNTLKTLVTSGRVERLQDPDSRPNTTGHWRIKTDTPRLADLAR